MHMTMWSMVLQGASAVSKQLPNAVQELKNLPSS
jgi:hypothetical protein